MTRNTRDIASREIITRKAMRRRTVTEIVHRPEYREEGGADRCREHVGIRCTETCCHEAGHTPPCTASAARITTDERGITVTYRDRETKHRVERVNGLRACALVLAAFLMRNAHAILTARINAILSSERAVTAGNPITAFYPANPEERRAERARALRDGAETLAELGDETAATLLRARAAAVAAGFPAVPSGLSFAIDDDTPTIVRTVTR
jgi:hypothetical protein